jgi:phosphatidylglycerophosphate synthase
MFDTQLRSLVERPLNVVAFRLVRAGLSADCLTLSGALIALGAVARVNGPTAWGGYLDSLADYVFYISIPVAFGLAHPENLVPALLLVASFTITAVSFLAFAAIAALQPSTINGPESKAFIYSIGLMEGSETIGFFVLFCLFPEYFGTLAFTFAALCLLTVVQRVWLASKKFP